MKSLIGTIILILIGAFQIVNAQEVNVAISYDTVYAGNDIAIQYSMENWQGELKNPDFGELKLINGPQTRSTMTYSGGQRHSSKTLLFILYPPTTPEEYILPAQTFEGEGEVVRTKKITITVLDNPEGIRQIPEILENGPRTSNKQYKRNEPTHGQRQRF